MLHSVSNLWSLGEIYKLVAITQIPDVMVDFLKRITGMIAICMNNESNYIIPYTSC